MVEQDLELPLSPELVLVSPELREHALLLELDAWLQAQSQSHVASPPGDLGEGAFLKELDARSELDVAPPVLPPLADTAQPEWRLTVGAATLIALSGLLVFGAGVAVGKLALPGSTAESIASTSLLTTQPTTAGPAAPPLAESTPAPATKPPARRVTRPQATTPKATARKPPKATTQTQARQPKPSATPPRPVKRAPKTVRLFPNGSYVMPGGRFRLSGNARMIVDFRLDATCAGHLALPPIPIAAIRTFAFAGRPAGAPSGTTVRVKGRFVSPTEARGTAQVTGTCSDPATTFVAHLS
jgi:outer membrane biosynthesis protein TonB